VRFFIFLALVSAIAVVIATSSRQSANSFESIKPDSLHRQKEVVVFVYHRFGNAKYPSTNISIDNFESHLSYLNESGFKMLRFSEALEYINNPAEAYEPRVACMTVDDGYKTFFTNALPLLAKYETPATVFVNSESVGGGTYMTWDELRNIYKQGIEIGNHSHSHAYFLNLDEQQRSAAFKKDVLICQQEIHHNLGFYPEVFAYPYGEYNPKMAEIVRELGFKGAAAQNSGVMHAGYRFSTPRFPMAGPYVHLGGFVEKANMKALRVVRKRPESSLIYEKMPPTLTISVAEGLADVSRASCFMSGNPQVTVDGNDITIRSSASLTGRRTLCTVTAPSKTNGSWYWYSHLWVQPQIAE
jgi:peptidoglycan/xylan/chitin deacetylase (PgdA/CDA1 family)